MNQVFRSEESMYRVILKVRELKTQFRSREGVARAVDGVDFELGEGEVIGIVGESGCGKSVTALSILRLIPEPPGEIVSGEVVFKGRNLLDLHQSQMRRIRGNQISMIFQEPMTSLNPVFRVGNQIAEAVQLHQHLSTKQAREKAIDMLRIVGIPSPRHRARDYPHQLSGGMLQRVMIAMAFSCNPEILVADEPTTALDVTIQSQILDLMQEMRQKTGSSVIFITHDMGIIAENSQRVLVMYMGKIVESSDMKAIFNTPLHPYTIGLLNSIPRDGKRKGTDELVPIGGIVPSLFNLPEGCSFGNRCERFLKGTCDLMEPSLIEADSGHWVRCWLYKK